MIRELLVYGYKGLQREVILATAGLRLGDRAPRDGFREATRRLSESGYLRSEGSSPAAVFRWEDIQTGISVTVRVRENPIVASFNLTGMGPIRADEVRACIESRPGHVLNERTLAADVQRITDLYRERGYIARVTTDATRQNGILDVNIRISEGRHGR